MATITRFLAIFDPRSSTIERVFDCRLSSVATIFDGREKKATE